MYRRGWATTCRPVQQKDTWRDNSWALFAIIGCARARGRPLVWENEQYSAGVYPLRERRNFDFCRCTGELRWKQHSAPLQRRVVYFVGLDWFSLPPIPRLLFPVWSLSLSFSLSHSLTFLLSLSLSLPSGSVLSGRHSMFVIEPGWARTRSLCSEQPAGRPRAVYFCSYSFPMFVYTAPYGTFWIIASELFGFAYTSNSHDLSISLSKFFFAKNATLQLYRAFPTLILWI